MLVTRDAPVLELDVSAAIEQPGAALLVIVDRTISVREPWPYRGARISVGYTRGTEGSASSVGGATAGALCTQLGERLEREAARAERWIARVRWFSSFRRRGWVDAESPFDLQRAEARRVTVLARLLACAVELSEREEHPARVIGGPDHRARVEDARAVAAGTDDAELLAACVHALLALRAYDDAFTLAERLPDAATREDEHAEPNEEQPTVHEQLSAHARAVLLALQGRHAAAARLLDAVAARCDAPESDATLRACAQGLVSLRRDEQALPLLERAVEQAEPARAASERLGLAALLDERGARARVLEVLSASGVDWAPDDRLRVAALLIKAGAFADAEAHLQTCLQRQSGARGGERRPGLSVRVRARHKLAQLALWRGQPERARELLRAESPSDAPEVARMRGAALVLEGRHEAALELLGHAIAGDERDGEARLWRCEALIRVGRAREAYAEIEGAHERISTAAGVVLQALSIIEMSPWRRVQFHLELRTRMFLDGFFHDRLVGLLPPEYPTADAIPRRRLRAVLWDILRRLAGNRSEVLTELVPAAGDGQPSLRLIEIPPSSRAAAVDALRRIEHEPPRKTLEGFRDARARYPWSPHPYTYRGELRLWLGDYHEAIADFNAAERVSLCRWAFVGRGAAQMMLGRPALAEADMAKGTRVFGFLAAATTTVYRGELLRTRGALDEALEQCHAAVAAKPSRMSTWVNIALIELARGRARAADEALAQVSSQAPGLLWEASRELGLRPRARLVARDDDAPAILERALVMMRGNRSSVIHTFFAEDGEFRVLPRAERWSAHARASLEMATSAIEHALVEGLLALEA